MAGKNSRKWTDVQLVLAAISMTSVLGFWNMFAGPDREKIAQNAALEQANQIPTPVPAISPTPMPVMPPPGYIIVFGGEAPKPQIIVQQARGGGGGGGGGGAPVTSSGSS